jgi:hypothetical protein
MKRVLLFFALTLCPFAAAQTVVQTIPQSTQQRAFTAVNTAQATGNLRNIGQTVHFLTYRTAAATPTRVQLRIEASNDGTNWFAISPDATDIASGGVFAFGYFPLIRVNLVSFGAGAGATLTADYSGTSTAPPMALGNFNPSLQNVRVLTLAGVQGTSTTYNVSTPFANAAGVLYFRSTGGNLPATTCTLSASSRVSNSGINILPAVNLAQTSSAQTFEMNGIVATSIDVAFTNCGASANTYELMYFFIEPMMPVYLAPDFVTGGFTEKNTEAGFVCTQSRAVVLTAAGNTEIVPAVTGKLIRICHVSFALSVAVNVNFVQGSGVACATGPANLSGVYQNVSAIALDFTARSALRTTVDTPAQAVCVNLSGIATGGGVVMYAQF